MAFLGSPHFVWCNCVVSEWVIHCSVTFSSLHNKHDPGSLAWGLSWAVGVLAWRESACRLVVWGPPFLAGCWSGPLVVPRHVDGGPCYRELVFIRGSEGKSGRGWPRFSISEVTPWDFCCILFVRSVSLGLGEGITQSEYRRSWSLVPGQSCLL